MRSHDRNDPLATGAVRLGRNVVSNDRIRNSLNYSDVFVPIFPNESDFVPSFCIRACKKRRTMDLKKKSPINVLKYGNQSF